MRFRNRKSRLDVIDVGSEMGSLVSKLSQTLQISRTFMLLSNVGYYLRVYQIVKQDQCLLPRQSRLKSKNVRSVIQVSVAVH